MASDKATPTLKGEYDRAERMLARAVAAETALAERRVVERDALIAVLEDQGVNSHDGADPERVADAILALPAAPLTIRENPVMPSDEKLHDMFGAAGGDDWTAKGLRAVWRDGCDAGMVAP